MKKHDAFTFLGLTLTTGGALLACVGPHDAWPAAVMVAGVVCGCTAAILKEIGR